MITTTRRPVVETSFLEGCICRSFISNKEIDNGTLISKGDLEENEREIYQAEFDVKKPAYLVADPKGGAEDYTYGMKYDEAFHTNEACVSFRGYKLLKDRRYRVTSDITTDKLKEGDFVIADENGKLKKATSADNPNNAFVGVILKVDNTGFGYNVGSAGVVSTVVTKYLVEVIKNEEVKSAGTTSTTDTGTTGTGN